MEELQARHRKEQRELQNRITQKKKQASKKTRKGVNDECDGLEAELRERQQSEISALNGDAGSEEPPTAALIDLTLQTDEKDGETVTNGTKHDESPVDEGVEGSDIQNGGDPPIKKQSRQKARLARRAAEQQEITRQAAEEAKNLPDLKQQERDRMLEYMKERGLQEKGIRADGHCLYSAVADQLEQLHVPLSATATSADRPAYRTVRAAAADYIEEHRDDFEPFLEEPLQEYLEKIRNTGEWGGQLELLALSKSYSTNINVLQDFGRVERIESGGTSDDKAMWLAYYKHGFGLGEHYNSLRKAP